MYDPIFAKSFSRYDRRRFGCFALLLSLIVALTVCSTFKPSLHPLTIIGEAVKMQVSINAIEDLFIQDEVRHDSDERSVESGKNLEMLGLEQPRFDRKNNYSEELNQNTTSDDAAGVINNTAAAPELIQDEVRHDSDEKSVESGKNLEMLGLEQPRFDRKDNYSEELNQNTTSDDAAGVIDNTTAAPEQKLRSVVNQNTTSDDAAGMINNTTAAPEQKLRPVVNQNTTSDDAAVVINNTAAAPEQKLRPVVTYDGEPLCRVLQANADLCEIEGDVRVDLNSSTIFLVTPEGYDSTSSWSIQPYPRKGIAFVKHWTVRYGGGAAVPECSRSHSIPALLFSIGGFTGNHFHDFADVLFPLFTTSFRSKSEIQFLVSDYKPWWLGKYRPLLDRLSRHVIIDADHDKNVHCFPKLTAGLNYHRELVTEPSSEVTMSQFRQFLRQTYSLGRNTAVRASGGAAAAKPRLLIVSRKWTRIIINEGEITRLATRMGYEVIPAESNISSNQTAVAQLVNSCDVMVGVHGAGLTNMVYLPEKAVVIQIVPLGKIGVFAKLDFGDPSKGMNMRHLEYEIGFEESSLSEKYAADDPVIKDPLSIHRQGWGKLRDVYLHNQNVTIDVRRFRATLAKALKLLRH